ncbi:FAD-dependent monooxygenase [Saccharomonospora viridis]|uniref:2-polyprenyl-6-methoxyphenol hydroxylase n=1 Tax=Saccharomonospora viridis TaxID=1852 RepID=A0A837D6S0_9PSEU|nr:FAD-dependent monooxygenase [Saccharomonospora viridis]KHF43152.1 2-polyprenyl-6-methoxyphenol hydroxylase [Saccharomonospora viridis]SFO83828.1 2-polyprenyl-6-methoxyphenol hydroxylase [Saccharomonospora viridis]
MEARVIGGGIGGLAAAVGLTRTGWQVTVDERATALSDDGTGLGMWSQAVAALGQLGLADELRRRGAPQEPGSILRPDGRRLVTVDTERLRRRTGETVYVVPRPQLLTLLFEALPEGTVRFGRPGPDPLECDADVVVGADGAHSAVRTRLFGPTYALRPTGYTVWRGVAATGVEQAGEVWGPAAKFGYSPLRNGRTNFYAVLPTPTERRSPDVEWELLWHRFGRCAEPVPSVLRSADPARALRHSLTHLAPALPRYVTGRTALLGDAAHTMTPDLGQGACQALLDGLVLARCLANVSSRAEVPAALADYDRLRRRPTQRIAAASRWLGRLSVLRHGTGVRDAVVTAAGKLVE